jgi:glycosyltransferase involved in cell wall biosynthesis
MTVRMTARIKKCRDEDERLIIIDEGKIGFVNSLNTAIQRARGRYIARMDADDLALPHRFARQKDLLDERPEVVLCGGGIRTFGQTKSKIIRFPSEHEELQCALLFHSALSHPSVMFRRILFTQEGFLYDPDFEEASDYALWVRCARNHRIANVSEVLLNYRIHPGQVSQTSAPRQRRLAQQIRLSQLVDMGLTPSPRQLQIHEALSNWHCSGDRVFVTDAGEWLEMILSRNHQTNYLSEIHLKALLAFLWYGVCTQNAHLGNWVHKMYFSSPLSEVGTLRLDRRLRFRIKSFIGSALLMGAATSAPMRADRR